MIEKPQDYQSSNDFANATKIDVDIFEGYTGYKILQGTIHLRGWQIFPIFPPTNSQHLRIQTPHAHQYFLSTQLTVVIIKACANPHVHLKFTVCILSVMRTCRQCLVLYLRESDASGS